MIHKLTIVKERGKNAAPRSLKTQIKRGGQWYTVADLYCVPGIGDAEEIGRMLMEAIRDAETRFQRAKDCLAGLKMLADAGFKPTKGK